MSNATNTLNVTNTLENYEELNESGFTNSQSNALATVMESSMQSILGHMDKRFDENDRRLDERFAAIDRRFDENNKRLEERFALIDKRFDVIDRRFDVIDRRFETIDRRFDIVDQRFGQVQWIIPVYFGIMTIAIVTVIAFIGF